MKKMWLKGMKISFTMQNLHGGEFVFRMPYQEVAAWRISELLLQLMMGVRFPPVVLYRGEVVYAHTAWKVWAAFFRGELSITESELMGEYTRVLWEKLRYRPKEVDWVRDSNKSVQDLFDMEIPCQVVDPGERAEVVGLLRQQMEAEKEEGGKPPLEKAPAPLRERVPDYSYACSRTSADGSPARDRDSNYMRNTLYDQWTWAL